MGIIDRARPAAGRLLAPLRRRAGRLSAAAVPLEARTAGWISVVMPVRDVRRYIDAAIRSVLEQGYWRVELIVVDDGSTDGTSERIARWCRDDDRVTTLRVDVGDPNAARNAGIALARGEYLAFLDGDDVLLAGAYRDLVRAVEASGSDFAVGGYDRLAGRERVAPAFWIAEAHRRDRPMRTARNAPDILVNAAQWTKLYRRAFWDRAGLAFPEGGHFQDQIVSSAAYARARSFDVLARPTVSWRIREDLSSMTQQSTAPRQIRDRFRTCAESLGILERESGAEIARERLVQYLSNDLAIVASQLPSLDDEGWAAVRDGLRGIAPEFGRSEIWDRVPAEFKVLYHFVVDGDRARALRYIESGGLDILAHELVERDGTAHIALPFWGDPEVPLERFRAAPRELRAFGRAITGTVGSGAPLTV